MRKEDLEANCRAILAREKRSGKKHKMDKNGISLQVRNIYLTNDVLFFEVGIKNSTDIIKTSISCIKKCTITTYYPAMIVISKLYS